MNVQTASPGGLLSYLVPIAIFAVIFFFRARRMSQTRPLKLEYLWMFPTLYLVVTILMLVQFPPTPVGWGICAAALAVGAALGWQRGKTMRITVDPVTHALNQKASVAGIAFIFVLIAVRAAVRAEGVAMHLNVALLTDALVVLALGLFATQRIEMYLRARRLLDEARAGQG
ncbi:CcdC protein domain-containing protein [uncultured Sphingomonas sp.]|uniref:CcdC protein domain-containing protein n=1 Tax=uncultured Sphingomonas sp. TaxID=158754 RepID=UPI0035CA6500